MDKLSAFVRVYYCYLEGKLSFQLIQLCLFSVLKSIIIICQGSIELLLKLLLIFLLLLCQKWHNDLEVITPRCKTSTFRIYSFHFHKERRHTRQYSTITTPEIAVNQIPINCTSMFLQNDLFKFAIFIYSFIYFELYAYFVNRQLNSNNPLSVCRFLVLVYPAVKLVA